MPSFESKIPKPVNDVTQSPFADKKPEPLLPDIMEEEKLSAANDKDAEQQQFSNEPGAEQKPEQQSVAEENAETDPVEKRKLQLEAWAKESEATDPTVQRMLQLEAWAKESEATDPTVQRMLQLQAWAKEDEATNPTLLRKLELQEWALAQEATNPTVLRKLELQKRFSLPVSQPDEPRELEADKKSEEVTSPRTVEASSDLLSGFDIGTSCPAPLLREEGSDARSEETLAAKGSSGGEFTVNRETKDYINNLPAGQSLPLKIKNFFQTRFGRSFNSVKIHNDRQANEAAAAINAKAFTKGTDIVFGEGQYQPETTDGKKLIAHELTHTLQQGGENVQRKTDLSDRDNGLHAGSVDYYYAHYALHGASLGIETLPDLIRTTSVWFLIKSLATEHHRSMNEMTGALFYANNVNSVEQLTQLVRSGKQLKTIKGLGWTPGFQYKYYDKHKEKADSNISGLSHFQRMKQAVEKSKIWPAIKQEFSNLKEFVLVMAGISALMLALAGTPAGPALALVLRLVGGLATLKLLYDTIVLLKDFYVITGNATTEHDINSAATKFAQAAAKVVSIVTFIGIFKVLRTAANRIRIWRKLRQQKGEVGTFNFSTPASRHFYNKINMKTLTKKMNTVVDPKVNVLDDINLINAGKSQKIGNTFKVNDRIYGVHDNSLYPISGKGFYQLDRGAFQALKVYKKFGDTAKTSEILKNMGITSSSKNQAYDIWKLFK